MASSVFDTRPVAVGRGLPGAARAHRAALGARAEWRFLRFLFLPLGLYALVTKARMLFDAAEHTGAFAMLDGWRSDPALYLFLFACSGLLLSVARGPVVRKLCAGAAIAVACIASLLTTASLYFHQVSGSQIDWVLSHAFLVRLREMTDVASSESGPMLLLHLGIPVLAAVLALRARPWKVPASPLRHRISRAGGFAGLAVVAGLLSAAPSLTLERRDLFLNAPLKVAGSLWASLNEPLADAEYDLGALAAARLVRSEERPWKNVVVIMLESTRASATTPYAESVPTTPFLTELAGSSLLALNAYAVLPHTSKATVSLLCGIEPHLRLAATESRPGAIAARCLPELLRDHGYATLYMMPDTKHFADWDQLVENTGHEDFVALEDMGDTSGYEWAHYFGKEDDVSLAPMRSWLEAHRHQPFLMSYLTATPHHDYQAPKRYGRHAFAEDDVFNRYLNAVHYQDHFLKNVFALFRELGLYEETVFVIVGDHGQAFMEHGRFGHSNVPYEEGLNVPLLIHAPGAFEDAPRVSHPTSQLDVLPTTAALLGFELEGGQYPGAPVWQSDADRVHFFSCWLERECVGSVERRWKHIHHFGDRPDELFDLENDPRERNDVAALHPELVSLRRRAALEWRSHVNARHERHLGYTGADRFLEIAGKR